MIDELDEALLAKGQDNLTKAIEAGDAQMTRWYMERKGRHLGYGPRIEAGVDTAMIERLVEAIAETGGLAGLRAVQAILTGAPTGGLTRKGSR